MIQHPEKSTNKAVSWFLTINNPTPHDEGVVDALTEAETLHSVKYAKWAVENGESNGVRHMHIYLHFTAQQRFSAIKKLWPKAHIEEPQGTVKQNIDYIGNPDFTYSEKNPNKDKRGKKKGGTCEYVREYGTTDGLKINQSSASGSNIDNRLLACKRLLDDGKELYELYEHDFPLMIKYGTKLSQYMTIKGLVQARDARDISRKNEEEDRETERRLIRDKLDQQIPFPIEEIPF